MLFHRPRALSIKRFLLALVALGVIWGCRASDIVDGIRLNRSPATAVAVSTSRPTRRPTVPAVALADTPSDVATEVPTDTVEPEVTDVPADTAVPVDTATPRPTRTPAPPTRKPPPTQTFTPAPPAPPTRCPYQFCIIKTDCQPGENTRAIGHVYSNGLPVNGVKVRVANAFGGDKVAADYTSGYNPTNKILDPAFAGYYQVGIIEGKPKGGTWVVFVVDTFKQPISEGRSFTTDAVQTGNSCQIGVTDFGS